MNGQVTSTHLHTTVQGYLETLALETDQAKKSEKMQKYLDFVAKFHQYSPSNIFLIMLARPDATQVAGYKAWKKMGRYVMKGEKGIPIFAPMMHKEDPDKDDSPKVLNGFRVVFVFDVTQTDGEPLPPIPDWKSLEQNDELRKKLIDFAEMKRIEVVYQDFPDETQGMSMGGKIILSPSSGVKTFVHELAHELLHRTEVNDISRLEMELEAESVGYIVCRHFGMIDLACPNYNAIQGGNSEIILKHFQRILGTATEIITSTVKQVQGSIT